jgi:preprotein translocase subunit SecE
MDSAVATNRKAATVGFMSAGVLSGIAVKVLVDSVAAVSTGAVGRVFADDRFRHVVPVVLGVLVFAVLQSKASVRAWGDEVASELRKVVWPSREDTTRMTIVTCIMLILSGIALGALDLFTGKLVEWLVNLDIVRFFSRIFGA